VKIRDVTVKTIEVPLTRVFVGSTYRVPSRCTVIVRLETDEGVVGEIYSGDERTHYREMKQLILERFKPLLVGEDPLAVERIWSKLFELTPHIANKEAAMQAIGAVDLAVWDLIGKSLNTPVHRLLGGCKTEIPIIGYTYFEDGNDPGSEAEVALQQQEQGYAGTKLKVGDSVISRDTKRVEAIRNAVGSDFILACDANRAWTVDQALEFARSVADLDLAWLEEPVRWHNEVDGMSRVRNAGLVPVTAGQSEISGFGCMELMKAGAVDYLNVDASIAGGITEWKRIAAAASFHGVGMVHHEEPQVAIHLLSAIPHSYCAELFHDPVRDPVWHQMYLDHPEPKNGKISPPDRPGLGIQIDHDFVERYLVE
jgi:D-galactarolactone cycloisomerase